MKVPRHRTLIQRMWLARMKKLTAKGPVLAASLVRNGKCCGRPGCRCERGEKHLAYYQIAHLIMQLLEKGSLLKQLAAQAGKTTIQLFGSLKNIARRLLECFRYKVIPENACDTLAAARIQIRLDSS